MSSASKERPFDEGAVGASWVYTDRVTSTVLALAATITLSLAAFVYGGAPLGLAVFSSTLIALVGWLGTTRATAAGPAASFNLMIATIVGLMLFVAEQWAAGFPARLIASFPAAYGPGIGLSDHGFIAVFALGGMAMLVLGALAYYHRLPIGEFAAWFTFSWAIFASLLAFTMCIFGSRPLHYVGGVATGPAVLILGVFGIRRLLVAGSALRPNRMNGGAR